jgi:hypothetical protein
MNSRRAERRGLNTARSLTLQLRAQRVSPERILHAVQYLYGEEGHTVAEGIIEQQADELAKP